jgi:tetratricopeptide (TPR) repeat protein
MRGFVAICLLVVTAMTAGAQTRMPNPRAIEAGRRGWAAIRDSLNEEAAKAFADALFHNPAEPQYHLGAGLAAYLLGDAADAQRHLEAGLRLQPGLTQASTLLGTILYRNSDLAGALRVYEAALAAAPNDANLAERVRQLQVEAEVQRDFYQAQGGHFTVLFEGPADDALAQRAIDILEDAYLRVGAAFNRFPDGPVTVVLYTEQQFSDITRSPSWAAAQYNGRIRIPVRGALRKPAELERVLFHEFTHVLVSSIAPRGVPTWLNEGLAVVFEPKGRAWSRKALDADTRRIPLGKLAGSFKGFADDDATTAYAESADAVARMIDLAGEWAVVALLQDIARGRPFAEAFGERMLVPWAEFSGQGLAEPEQTKP